MTSKLYRKPGFATKHVFNPLIEGAARLGLSLRGSQVIEVQGRTSGKWYSTPVNPLTFNGARYLVAPRGETQWARNLRAKSQARLKLGRRTETVRAVEIPDEEKVPIIRAYLNRWASETKGQFGISGADAPDDELQRIAPAHPVFRIEAA